MFGKKGSEYREHPMRTKSRNRMARLSDIEILNWADQAGTGVAKALDDFRRFKSSDAIREAEEGLAALAGAVDVLNGRH